MILTALQLVDSEDDRQLIQDLYINYQRLLYATASRHCFRADCLDDIIQESFLRLIGKLETLRSLEPPARVAYLVSTVRNTALNVSRRQAREAQLFTPDADTGADGPADGRTAVDERVLILEKLDCLSAVWPSLSQHDRILLESKYLLGYSNQELARLLGCKPDSVRTKLTRARRRAVDLMRKKGQVE